MELKDQVCSLEHSKRLKELGTKQDIEHGDFAYCDCCDELHAIRDDNDEGGLCGEDYSHRFYEVKSWTKAFTVAELGEMLPRKMEWNTSFLEDGGVRFEMLFTRQGCKSDTEANARALMLIYLLENGLLSL